MPRGHYYDMLVRGGHFDAITSILDNVQVQNLCSGHCLLGPVISHDSIANFKVAHVCLGTIG